jgi:hypothetical protein
VSVWKPRRPWPVPLPHRAGLVLVYVPWHPHRHVPAAVTSRAPADGAPMQKSLRQREPNGRLSRAGRDAVGALAPAAIRRLRDAALAGMAAPEWGTELGLMYLRQEIDAALYEAGRRWARLVAEAQRASGAPAHVGSGSDIDRTPDRRPDPETSAGRREAEHDRAVLADARSALRALEGAGAAARALVLRVCEQNRPAIGLADRTALLAGLAALALHWRLMQRPRATRG